jgi:hypothetical protein
MINPHWRIAYAAKINGRHVTPGTELRIRGERGRWTFVRHVTHEVLGTAWVDVRDRDGALRSFHTCDAEGRSRVTRVHVARTARPARASRVAVAA